MVGEAGVLAPPLQDAANSVSLCRKGTLWAHEADLLKRADAPL